MTLQGQHRSIMKLGTGEEKNLRPRSATRWPAPWPRFSSLPFSTAKTDIKTLTSVTVHLYHAFSRGRATYTLADWTVFFSCYFVTKDQGRRGPIRSVIFGKDRFLIFWTKKFLRPRRSLVPSFSAVLRLEVEEKGEGRISVVLIHSAAPSPVVVPNKESPHMPNNKRKSGCCRACRQPVRGCTILAHRWSKRKRCSLVKLLLVKLSSPGLGLVVVVALSLMFTSLQRIVSCHLRRHVRTPPFRRRGLRLREHVS